MDSSALTMFFLKVALYRLSIRDDQAMQERVTMEATVTAMPGLASPRASISRNDSVTTSTGHRIFPNVLINLALMRSIVIALAISLPLKASRLFFSL